MTTLNFNFHNLRMNYLNTKTTIHSVEINTNAKKKKKYSDNLRFNRLKYTFIRK